jgi:hypothetical protein
MKQRSGGARLVASGKKPMLLGLTPEQHEEIRLAALSEERPMTQYVIHHVVAFARKNNEKNRKRT